MELRKDIKRVLESDWEPKVPEEDVILKQAKAQLKKGKSSGSVALDIKAMKNDQKWKQRGRIFFVLSSIRQKQKRPWHRKM